MRKVKYFINPFLVEIVKFFKKYKAVHGHFIRNPGFPMNWVFQNKQRTRTSVVEPQNYGVLMPESEPYYLAGFIPLANGKINPESFRASNRMGTGTRVF